RHLPIEPLHATLTDLLSDNALRWHGVELDAPDWGRESHTLAVTMRLFGDHSLLHAMINAYWEPLDFQLPDVDVDHGAWRRCIDTALVSPQDICRLEDAPGVDSPSYTVESRSVVVLVAPAQAPATVTR
ncbi:MAG TPA: glycogen debranching enzyme, partial [Candidatus Binatia bacterium]|nr:glycogen debranching enzyme [Candidatus Binatia bacterium]